MYSHAFNFDENYTGKIEKYELTILSVAEKHKQNRFS